MTEYCRILNVFYSEVHRQMILNGYGYSFEGSLGWICINRCHKVKSKPTIDFAATKKRKQEILAQGKKLYNKEYCVIIQAIDVYGKEIDTKSL